MHDNPISHRVTVVVDSYMDSPEVSVEIKWEPELTDAEIAEMGYLPAAYRFVEATLISAVFMSQGDTEIEQEDIPRDRVIN